MSKNSAIIKMIPQIDYNKMKEGIKKINSLTKTLNIGKNIAKTGVKAAAGFSLLSVVLSQNEQYLESMNELMTELVGKADSLSTINADLGSSWTFFKDIYPE